MASNNPTVIGFNGEQVTTDNAPAWTVPSDYVPNSDTKNLLANQDPNAPNSNEIPPPSAPNKDDLPPNYFDISIVPNNAVLHYNEVTPYTEASKAEVERESKGVLSFDPLIDKNPDQLWLYFMTYLNEKPSLGVNIHGYHIEVLYEYIF
jgi:hypothetical protein